MHNKHVVLFMSQKTSRFLFISVIYYRFTITDIVIIEESEKKEREM